MYIRIHARTRARTHTHTHTDTNTHTQFVVFHLVFSHRAKDHPLGGPSYELLSNLAILDIQLGDRSEIHFRG